MRKTHIMFSVNQLSPLLITPEKSLRCYCSFRSGWLQLKFLLFKRRLRRPKVDGCVPVTCTGTQIKHTSSSALSTELRKECTWSLQHLFSSSLMKPSATNKKHFVFLRDPASGRMVCRDIDGDFTAVRNKQISGQKTWFWLWLLQF